MKRLFTLLPVLCSSMILLAQDNKPKPSSAPKPTTTSKAPSTSPKPVAPAVVLKNSVDSFSYALGVSLASYYKSQGIAELNSALLGKACTDLLGGKQPLLDNNVASTILNNYMTKLKGEKSKVAKEAGEKYLSENSKRPGVITTASGLQYEVIQEGTGESPVATDTVTCHYTGTFLDGMKFDSSHDHEGNQPISFPLSGVIRGWTEGLQLMKVGAKYKFAIPYTLGYGEYDYMTIPGGSTLLFEVELLEIKKPK